MREYLFRGKSVGTGKWIEGFYCGENCEHPFSRNMVEKPYIIRKGTGFWFEVIPETVGQFTGLTDKNGKKIFEGDVIRAYSEIGGYDFTAEVEWGNFIKGWYCGKHRPMYDGFNNEYEVIGNKWDNPELLEGGAE